MSNEATDGAGWTCIHCHAFIPWNEYHVCLTAAAMGGHIKIEPPVHVGTVNVANLNLAILERIAKALEKCAVALEELAVK